jgi:hypothetical protein
MIKSNPCKLCSSTYHTAAFCPQKPKKAIKRTPIKVKSQRSIVHKGKIIAAKGNKKAPTRSQLVKKLDKVFSEFIRLRDDGKGCVTCGDVKPWREMQNCHFYSRGRQNTRWEETNCHSGCYRCNVLLKGNYISYTIYMIDTYGREHVDYLEKLSKSTNKITTVKLKEMIEYYTNVVQSIDKT